MATVYPPAATALAAGALLAAQRGAYEAYPRGYTPEQQLAATSAEDDDQRREMARIDRKLERVRGALDAAPGDPTLLRRAEELLARRMLPECSTEYQLAAVSAEHDELRRKVVRIDRKLDRARKALVAAPRDPAPLRRVEQLMARRVELEAAERKTALRHSKLDALLKQRSDAPSDPTLRSRCAAHEQQKPEDDDDDDDDDDDEAAADEGWQVRLSRATPNRRTPTFVDSWNDGVRKRALAIADRLDNKDLLVLALAMPIAEAPRGGTEFEVSSSYTQTWAAFSKAAIADLTARPVHSLFEECAEQARQSRRAVLDIIRRLREERVAEQTKILRSGASRAAWTREIRKIELQYRVGNQPSHEFARAEIDDYKERIVKARRLEQNYQRQFGALTREIERYAVDYLRSERDLLKRCEEEMLAAQRAEADAIAQLGAIHETLLGALDPELESADDEEE